MLKKWHFQVKIYDVWHDVWYQGFSKEDAIDRFFTIFKAVGAGKVVVR